MTGSTAARRAPQPTATYLAETFELLWPGSALAPTARGAAGFVAVPSMHRPRVVVPRRPLAVTAAALRSSRRPRTRTSAAVLWGMSALARMGAADLLPDRLAGVAAPTGQRSDLVDHLSRELGRQVFVSLLVGPVRATQKPVLQVFTREADVVGFAKIGSSPLTRALVVREADVLTELGGRDLGALRVPELLYRGAWNGHEVLVQEAFSPRRELPVEAGLLTGAMVALATVAGVVEGPLRESGFWTRMRGTVLAYCATAAPGDGVATALTDAVRRVERARGEDVLRWGSWHGDWAPWNMTSAGGDVMVWDWETFTGGVPLGFDLIHHGLQSAVVLDGVPAAEAIAAAADRADRELAAFGVAEADRRLTVVLYLLHLVEGFLNSGENSARLARLQTWVPSALALAVQDVVSAASVRPGDG